jgi:hypothetical protein
MESDEEFDMEFSGSESHTSDSDSGSEATTDQECVVPCFRAYHTATNI